MKTVEWTGPERTLGIHGYVKAGVIKKFLNRTADQFISMGWCVEVEVKRKAKKEVSK